MLPDYKDITSRLGESLWYDRHGVPRYDPFRPDMCGVYARYISFLSIECQSCRRLFKVVVDWSYYEFPFGTDISPWFPSAEDEGDFFYGDPPPHNCGDEGLCAGSTMNSITRRILEFWIRDKNLKWERRPEYEFAF